MPQHEEDSPSPSSRPRHHLPALAPRREGPSPPEDRRQSSASLPSTRTARLSHRSRAGCYTCRGRKVKCDEKQPRCGPCVRLHKECDWEVRWNFSDATSSTQHKHSHISISGSTVWDPTTRAESPLASPGSASGRDDLPAFARLTNDEDRERKAETNLPGTYSVVVTPRSFADLPEYASSASAQKSRSRANTGNSTRKTSNPSRRDSSRTDPNIVVLDRFEESSPTRSLHQSPSGQGGLPETMQHMSLNIPSPSTASSQPDTPVAYVTAAESRLIAHFRRYIAARLVPRRIQVPGDNMVPGSLSDMFENEASKFLPLHHAICALSALNLSYHGQATLEEAIGHYDKALSAQTPTASAGDLLSDGVFLRHYLLFIYDISMTVDASNAGAGMWVDHLKHLLRLTQDRFARFGREPHAFVMWAICSFDTYACLLGNGNCDYFRTILDQRILPPLGASISAPGLNRDEVHSYSVIMHLARGVFVHTSKIGQAAQIFRSESAGRVTVSPGRCARWQAQVSQLQTELSNFWLQAYPDFLGKESALAGQVLDPRLQYVFEHAFLLYQAATIYSRTSMFPGQRLIPIANQSAFTADTAVRVSHILTLASDILAKGELDRREVAFPVFMAGFAASDPDAKARAIDLLKAFEGHGIGQNTSVVRRLLVGVCEEQRRRAEMGRRMEEVDWLRLGRERGLSVVNCGL